MKATQIASVDWKDPSVEGPLRQGPVSSQPAPLSALGAPEKLVGPLSRSLGHNELLTLSRSALVCEGRRCHEANYSHSCPDDTPPEGVRGPTHPAGGHVRPLVRAVLSQAGDSPPCPIPVLATADVRDCKSHLVFSCDCGWESA